MAEMILPGTYIEVRDEGLISAGQVSTGNIGIVGTAVKGQTDSPVLISSLTEARDIFGLPTADTTLLRALELIYKNGGRTVYAVRTGQSTQYVLEKDSKPALTLVAKTPGDNDNIKIKVTKTTGDSATEGNATGGNITESSDAPKEKKTVEIKQGEETAELYTVVSLEDLAEQINRDSKLVIASELNEISKADLPNNVASAKIKHKGADPDYKDGLSHLEQDIVNIVVLAGQDASNAAMLAALEGHLKITAGIKRERIGIIGTGFKEKTDEDALPNEVPDNGRLILTTPGVLITEGQNPMRLSGGYMAAAIAGVISSLPVKTSLTNKTLALEGLTTQFNSGQLEKLIKQDRVLAVEKRNGFRIVKGITTDSGAWQQITTRRIVDYAIYGVRSACDPYIGKLNNVRVRGAMKATLDGFLTRMVDDESLVSYELEVSATRKQEIDGKAVVNMTLMPTFSIDFIQVTMSLS